MTTLERAMKDVEAAASAKTGPITDLEKAMSRLATAMKPEIEHAKQRIEDLTAERESLVHKLGRMTKAIQRLREIDES